MSKIVLEARAVTKAYHEKMIDVTVFEQINIAIEAGELVSIIGPSGSGKSTLLHLLGGLNKPSKGDVLWSGVNIGQLSESALSRKRNETLGFIYQFHHLLPEFTVLENVAMPLLIGGMKASFARDKAASLLEQVGLQSRLKHKISEISGGERQRTAIARALVTEPLCVLADEPTGNLDQATADQVFQVMLDLQKNAKTSFVIVTHDMALARRATRILRIDRGCLRID